MTSDLHAGLSHHQQNLSSLTLSSSAHKSQINISRLLQLIDRQDYSTIIRCKELCWSAFCLAVGTSPKKLADSRSFAVVKSGEFLKISGQETLISRINTAVGLIRRSIEMGIQANKDLRIFFPCILDDLYFCTETIDKIPERFNLSEKNLDGFSIHRTEYLNFIKPYFEQFSKSIGTNFFISHSMHQISLGEGREDLRTKLIEVIYVEILQKIVFPIVPMKVKSDEGFNAKLSALYQSETFCDLDFYDNGSSLKAHAVFLYMHGGEVMKELLISQDPASILKKIKEHVVSIPLMRVYTDFRYMTLDSFYAKYSKKGACDLFHLFQFAHAYKEQPLLNCCTNLMSLLCGPRDVPAIEKLADHYQNDHLKRIACYLKEGKTKEKAFESVPTVECEPVSQTMESMKIAELRALITGKNFFTVFKSEKLFWGVFCLSVKKSERQSKEDAVSFSVDEAEGVLNVSGSEEVIDKVKAAVENLRSFYLEGYQKRRDFDVSFPVVAGNIYYSKGSDECIDLFDWRLGTVFKIHKQWFHKFVKPFLGRFSDLVGLNLSTSKKMTRLIKESWGQQQSFAHVEAMKLKWKRGEIAVYPINPVEIIETDINAKEAFYPLYRDQILCDLNLQSKQGVIRVHKVFIYLYGAMQKRLLTALNRIQIINFKDFDENIVRAYADFTYMRLENFIEKYSKRGNCDLYKLLKFSQYYQMESLRDCCTNLIALLSDAADEAAIELLSLRYNNRHLKQLGDYWRTLRLRAKEPPRPNPSAPSVLTPFASKFKIRSR